MGWNFEIGKYDPCPCGSGDKYKFCCAKKAKANQHGQFPVGAVACYGPDDKLTTKIVVGIFLHEGAVPIVEEWIGTDLRSSPQVEGEIRKFFARHGVKTAEASAANVGCPHDPGKDYPRGGDCPLCPFWAGKQGSGAGEEEELWKYLQDDGTVDQDDELMQAQELADEDKGNKEEAGKEGLDEEDEEDEEETDFDALFERMEAVLGEEELDMGAALDKLMEHLKANLKFPFEVKGIEDFQWEERYVIGGWDPREYRRLKKSQPSYTDRYQLIGIERRGDSNWKMCWEDMEGRVQRISDGKLFMLGLSELEAVEKKSENGMVLNDYAVWFVNSR
jgi:hypothetical protein